MNLLIHLSRQYSQKGRGTVFLIINFSFVAATLKARLALLVVFHITSCLPSRFAGCGFCTWPAGPSSLLYGQPVCLCRCDVTSFGSEGTCRALPADSQASACVVGPCRRRMLAGCPPRRAR